MQFLVQLDTLTQLGCRQKPLDRGPLQLAEEPDLGDATHHRVVLLADLVLHEHRRVVGVDVALRLHRGPLALGALRGDDGEVLLALAQLILPRRPAGAGPVFLEQPVHQ